MQLALFTPGAYIWPVHRSFEAFIASLGAPAAGAAVVADSALYPAGQFTDSALHGMPARLDARLTLLHRELYEALLRPVEFYARDGRSFAEAFAADLLGTPAADLLSAFTYFFVRRAATELSIVAGLAVLRAVFFNHEAADPALWLYSSQQRLQRERAEMAEISVRFTAPPQARVQQLAFALIADRERPAGGAAWICGEIRRQLDGLVRITAGCGIDPSLAAPSALAAARPRITADITAAVSCVFGWQRQEAA